MLRRLTNLRPRPVKRLAQSAQHVKLMHTSCHPIVRTNSLPDEKKTAVIFGYRSELGRVLATRFLASEWNVIGTTQGRANHKLDEKGLHLEGDVNLGHNKAHTEDYWLELLTKIQSQHGRIHTVINCAAISINDPTAGYSMDDVNRKPVAPMLKACIDLGIDRFTFISSQAAKYIETRKPNSYSNSKYEAEQDIEKIMASHPNANTQVSILRPDLIISADNPGHFGSPQRMSTVPFIKFTVGKDPRKAGTTLLQPVASIDVADAIVNISDFNINTPQPIDLCGTKVISIEDLMTFFKEKQHKRFFIGLKFPCDSMTLAAKKNPRGAVEPDHLDLIAHHEKQHIEKCDISEFERIVGLTRPDKYNPLFTLEELFDLTKRPVFGTHDLGLYTNSLFKKLDKRDIVPMLACLFALARTRIDFSPHRKTADRGPNDGYNIGILLATLVSVGVGVRVYELAGGKESQKAAIPENHQPAMSENQQVLMPWLQRRA